MIRAHTADQVRAAERPLLEAGEPLMRRAALAVELAVVAQLRSASGAGRIAGADIVVLAGSGGNGGDGLYAAAGLARRGAAVTVLLVGAEPHPDALAAVRASAARVRDLSGGSAQQAGEAVGDAVAGAQVVIDAVAGIGVRGGLRALPRAVIERASAVLAAAPAPAFVLAVDTPSGIGVDDGSLPGPVLPADLTLTMGSAKPGLLLPPAAERTGRVVVVELGLPLADQPVVAARLTGADVADLWPVPGPHDHKYTRGVLGVLAGSDAYPGAAVLVTSAAAPLVGMVRYLGPDGAAGQVLQHRPEVVVGEGRVQGWVLGSGIGEADTDRLAQLREVLAAVLAAAADSSQAVPVVVDAGGLAALPDTVPARVVLTPHAGELARLLASRGESVTRSQVEAEPVRWLHRAVALTGATVLLKGATTLVAGPGTPVYSQADATDWLASAGAGDVLAGLVGAGLAGCYAQDPGAADNPDRMARMVAAAVLVHGRAACRASGGGPLVALDVAHAAPRVLAELIAG